MGHKFIKNLPKIFYFSTHFIIIVFWMKKIYKNTKRNLTATNFLQKINVFEYPQFFTEN